MFKIKKPTIVDDMGDPIRVGDWKREKELGSGGFGVVSLWINTADGDCLAIKKCKWSLESSLTEKQRKRWISEVEKMQTIDHENIVHYRRMPEILWKALAKSNPSNLPILSMEYCSLGNLRSEILKPHKSCGVGEFEVISILTDVSNGLIYLHNLNITHRDLKPENIVLQNCNTRKAGIIYKIIDLGYAKELNTKTVSFVGTLQYLAPEMFENQTYNSSVDYWSLGITAFEVVCGIRPFLPAFNPGQSFEYIKKKDSDVICIQMTHTGDIKSSRELLKEIHINTCLKQHMEAWFRSVLQFDPERRGVIENNNIDVLPSLQTILSKRIITVFSIYKFEFYSYEVNDSTLFSTLQDWIARDLKIQKTCLVFITPKKSNSNFAIDYYDQDNSDAMLFVFKRHSCISEQVSVSLPKLIRIMFENPRTEFKFGTLRLLSGQIIYFINHEIKHFRALSYGVHFLNVLLKEMAVKEDKLFKDVINSLQSFLPEIEFYNKIEISLHTKVYKDTNNIKIKSLLSEYEHQLHQLNEIIDTVNALFSRHKKSYRKSRLLQYAFNEVLNQLRSCDFNSLSRQAVSLHEELIINTPVKNLTARRELVQIVSQTLKIRDKMLMNNYFQHFLKGATNYWSELQKLTSCLLALNTTIGAIKENMRSNIINKLELVQNTKQFKEDTTARGSNGIVEEIIQENIALRYRMQEFIDASIAKYKNVAKETNMQQECSQIQTGIDL